MRKTAIIFLSVMVLAISGCGNKKADVAVNTEPKESVTETNEPESEKVVKEESETEEVKETETESVTEESGQTAQKQENSEKAETDKDSEQAKTENQAPDKTNETAKPEKQEEAEAKPEAPAKKPEQVQEPTRVEYSPQNVVTLATAKTKAAGKVLLTENLDNLLASGQISQDEYNEYYPYDGAGYYSVFVDSNMAEARSVSGSTKFNSEDEIAQYIADMLALENGQYFLIEYAGTYDYYGKQCYEFRCYRA